MARIIGALASSHTPTIGFAFDRDKRDDPAWAPIFKHYEPLQQWLEDKKPDVLFFDLQRSRHLVLLRSLLRVRARHRREISRSPTKAAARATCRRSWAPGPGASHRRSADRRRIRHVVLPGQGARPRLLLAALDACAPQAGRGWPRHRPARRSACCSFRFRPRGAATNSASRCAAPSRAIRKT